jgi:hypothetical protein
MDNALFKVAFNFSCNPLDSSAQNICTSSIDSNAQAAVSTVTEVCTVHLSPSQTSQVPFKKWSQKNNQCRHNEHCEN